MLSRMGLSSSLDRCSASSPHGYQSTGLLACCNRYGLVSLASRLGMAHLYKDPPLVAGRFLMTIVRQTA